MNSTTDLFFFAERRIAKNLPMILKLPLQIGHPSLLRHRRLRRLRFVADIASDSVLLFSLQFQNPFECFRRCDFQSIVLCDVVCKLSVMKTTPARRGKVAEKDPNKPKSSCWWLFDIGLLSVVEFISR
ncbi:hypothetical protein Droror1_Dr00023498 [Drosera rotundifolia]